MSLDKLAADTVILDPRLRIASDSPECFLCGKHIVRTTSDPVTVETQNSIGLHAHGACCNNMPALDLFAAYWKAIRAAMTGERETPNPGPARIFSGDFA